MLIVGMLYYFVQLHLAVLFGHLVAQGCVLYVGGIGDRKWATQVEEAHATCRHGFFSQS